MFVKNLKRYYPTCIAFSLGIMLSKIVENLGAADFSRLAINVFMVLAFSFALYCVGFCVMALIRNIRHLHSPKLFSVLLILMMFSTLSPVMISDVSANQQKQAVRQLLRDGLIFVGGVVVANQVDDAIDAVEDAAYDAVSGDPWKHLGRYYA